MLNELRHAAGLIAALVLATLGFFLIAGAPLIGGALLVLGAGAAFWQAARLFRQRAREDPYDLNRLWERPPPPPEEADENAVDADEETLFCHQCGHAVPPAFARCPECGLRLK